MIGVLHASTQEHIVPLLEPDLALPCEVILHRCEISSGRKQPVVRECTGTCVLLFLLHPLKPESWISLCLTTNQPESDHILFSQMSRLSTALQGVVSVSVGKQSVFTIHGETVCHQIKLGFFYVYSLNKKGFQDYILCSHLKLWTVDFEYALRCGTTGIEWVFHLTVFQPSQLWLPGHRPAAPHSDLPHLAAGGNIANASAKKLWEPWSCRAAGQTHTFFSWYVTA